MQRVDKPDEWTDIVTREAQFGVALRPTPLHNPTCAIRATDMGILLRLAWLNLWRHKRRTWLTASAIAFITTLLIFIITCSSAPLT